MEEAKESRYRSRKFRLTMLVAMSAVALCAFGKMTGGECAGVLTVCVGGYNLANAWTTGKGAEKW